MSSVGIDPRVTGTQRYSIDLERPNMLHAAFVRSPYAHARVKSVDASALPDGCVALVPEDVADLGHYGCQARDQRVLADVARFPGDVVAAVAAATREQARDAARLIEVQYEELPAVFDPVEAVAPGAPLVHPQAAASAEEAVSIDVQELPQELVQLSSRPLTLGFEWHKQPFQVSLDLHKGEEIPVRASTAQGDERTRLWSLMAEVWPAYDDYQTKTEREIPVVVFSRR